MRRTDVRSDVHALWAGAYKRCPPERFSHAVAWQHAKNTVSKYLLDRTAEQRMRAAPRTVVLKKQLQTLCTNCVSPSPAHDAARKQLEKALRAEQMKPRAHSPWWNYLNSLKEEVSSKVFYRNFKAKHSSPDIAELSVTPDWDDPSSKAASGLKWRQSTGATPPKGKQLTNPALSAALEEKLDFTRDEWDSLGAPRPTTDSFIEAGGKYFHEPETAETMI